MFTAVLDWELGGCLPEEEELECVRYFADTPEDLAYAMAQLEAKGRTWPVGADVRKPVRRLVRVLDDVYSRQKWHPGDTATIASLVRDVEEVLTAAGV